MSIVPRMRKSQRASLIFIALVTGGGFLFFLQSLRSVEAEPSDHFGRAVDESAAADAAGSITAIGENIPFDLRLEKVEEAALSPLPQVLVPTPRDIAAVVVLNAGNFENFVGRCFHGEPCSLEENPEHLYRDFKLAGRTKANGDLIDYLRRQMKVEEFRERYKEPLKKMIEDFYSAHDLPFQLAAYYHYIGDLDRSLAMYLDLEVQVRADATLRPAPPLNIANLYYDLKKYPEALEYYRKSRAELFRAPHMMGRKSSDGVELLAFVEHRMEELKATLRR